MQRPDFKRARQELTGGMPTGSYDMSSMEFSVTRKGPIGWTVEQLQAWPAPQEKQPDYLDYLI